MGDEDNGKKSEQKYLWNIFREKDQEREKETASNAKDNFLRVVKVGVYVLLFILVCGGSIVTKASLQILTNEFHKEKKARFSTNLAKDAIAYYLLFILVIPDAVQMLLSCFIFAFSKRTLPSLRHLVNIVVKECLHIFSLAIIVFKILPKLNSVEVCAFFAVTPLIPSILQTKCRTECFKIQNICSILLQAAIVCAVPLYKKMKDQITTEETMWMIFASVVVSIRWVDTYFMYSSNSKEPLTSNADETIIGEQSATTLVTSLCRVFLVIILFPSYLAQNIQRPEIAFERKPELHMECLDSQLNITCCTHYADTSLMTTVFVHFFVCMGLYYTAVLATRVCMDKICFCAALAFGAPVYVAIILISRVNDNWISNTFIKDVENIDLFVMVVVFAISWLSQLRICRHIWNSQHDRVVFKNKLFVLPHYCSPIADLSLLHSRKNDSVNVQNKNSADATKPAEKTTVYICATMWHENRTEMRQIIKTLFRLYKDRDERKKLAKDEYKLEGHIFFDDAVKTTEGKQQLNEFVKQLMDIINDAMEGMTKSQVFKKSTAITPYGGRLTYEILEGNKLIVHIKDKDKIRHKKRWSQIMYMYYLLGYKLLDKFETESNLEKLKKASSIFDLLHESGKKANDTFIMALDGDVDFSPEALQLLLDRMKTNKKVGAACGRIRPGGSGPVVWYQKFEYAIGHWLQKSAEHVFGCVLCSPGCFSLFRAKALMDDNIMRTYASMSSEPKHYLQYDQGEDRWLCTLMLKQGYRIEYCAAAEAVTFAPEEFREFFNQRRRWVPSTMANILDLLISYKSTTRNNSNISRLYILYQGILFLSSILGPSLVLLVMHSAITSVFKDSVSLWVAYLLIYGPTLVFIFICFKCSTQTQLTVAMALSAIYALFMVAVFVGTVVNIAEEGIFTPNAIFMYVLIGIFLIAGLLHPHEMTDLFWGVLYFVCIPAGYLFLMVYAICNLNNVSWGTRETQTAVLEQTFYGKQSQNQKMKEEYGVVSGDILEDILKEIKASKVKTAWYTDLVPAFIQCHNNQALLQSLESVHNIVKNTASSKLGRRKNMKTNISNVRRINQPVSKHKQAHTESLVDVIRAVDQDLTVENLLGNEKSFWEELIKEYLKPIDSDKQREKEIAQSLKEYRDKVAFAFFFVNALWVVVMSTMNEVKSKLNIKIPAIGNNTVIEPLGLIFLSIFTILLFLQFIAMLRHRYGTFLHVMSATNIQTMNRVINNSEINETQENLLTDK